MCEKGGIRTGSEMRGFLDDDDPVEVGREGGGRVIGETKDARRDDYKTEGDARTCLVSIHRSLLKHHAVDDVHRVQDQIICGLLFFALEVQVRAGRVVMYSQERYLIGPFNTTNRPDTH